MYKTQLMEESEFRDLVIKEHKAGHFKRDPHKMQVDFKLNKASVGFVGLAFYDESSSEVAGFVGLDVYESKEGTVGMIHCLGVPQKYRRKGLSVELLKAVEEVAKSKYGLVAVYSICNPISEKSHLKAGYVVTHPGRLSPSGKRMQIRLKKHL